jgi:hypothetical protein
VDRRINFCVNQIRRALRDPAEHSQYIKTVPRRGYRFVAAITRIAPDEHRPPLATPADDESRSQVSRTAPTLLSDAIGRHTANRIQTVSLLKCAPGCPGAGHIENNGAPRQSAHYPRGGSGSPRAHREQRRFGWNDFNNRRPLPVGRPNFP